MEQVSLSERCVLSVWEDLRGGLCLHSGEEALMERAC